VTAEELPNIVESLGWKKFLRRFCAVSGIGLSERIRVSSTRLVEFFEPDVVDFHPRYILDMIISL